MSCDSAAGNSFAKFDFAGLAKKSVTFSFICASATCFTPLVSRKSREMSTIALPRWYIFILLSSVTVATTVAVRFSLAASAANFSAFSFAITTAILSCDSEMASSVPESPSYFLGTLSSSIISPSASSPMATDTPPAPKSLHFLIKVVAFLFKNNLWSFLSVSALPFCTSAPQVCTDFLSCALDEPVAPPQPSRPVSPPKSTITSPLAGFSR